MIFYFQKIIVYYVYENNREEIYKKMDIDRCIEFATEMHKDQKRKDGTDYITHPLRVALYIKNQGYGPEYQITAIFHDLLEDTQADEKSILELSNEDVLKAVKLLTKEKGIPGDVYIREILKNPIAKAVKNADRIDNLTDALTADLSFVKGYIHNTKRFYCKRFSKELDDAFNTLERVFKERSSFTYTIDSSFSNMPPLYRQNKLNEAWSFNYQSKKWTSCSPYFWASIEDNALNITESEAIEYGGNRVKDL